MSNRGEQLRMHIMCNTVSSEMRQKIVKYRSDWLWHQVEDVISNMKQKCILEDSMNINEEAYDPPYWKPIDSYTRIPFYELEIEDFADQILKYKNDGITVKINFLDASLIVSV